MADGRGGVGGGWIGEVIKMEAARGAGRCRGMVSAVGQKSIGSLFSSGLSYTWNTLISGPLYY